MILETILKKDKATERLSNALNKTLETVRTDKDLFRLSKQNNRPVKDNLPYRKTSKRRNASAAAKRTSYKG